MAYLEDYALAMNSDFRKRVRVAMLAVARQVCGEEPEAGTSVEKTNKRHRTAMHVIYKQEIAAEMISFLLVSIGGVSASSTDTQIYNYINAGWDKLAGVTYEEQQTT